MPWQFCKDLVSLFRVCLIVFVIISYPTDKNDPKIDEEIDKIKLSQVDPSQKPSLFDSWKEFLKPELYKPFFIMVSFFALQQFSGIFVIFVYAAQFSIEAGVVMDEFLAAVIIGIIRCVSTMLVAFASDKLGRKFLVSSSGFGMFLCMTGLIICAAFPLNDTSFSWLPAILLFGFIFTGTFGILSLPFAMLAEMYPQKSRGFVSGITISLMYMMNFVVIKTFSDLFELFGNVLVFSFYAFVAVLGVAFGIYILPETKGKSLEEIENYFKKK
jgi:MFS family permease